MKKILFICIGNTCRSQIAKGFFNTLSSTEFADSAGIQPEISIDLNTIKVMNEVGIDVSHYEPKKFTVKMNDQFNLFVIMDRSISSSLTPQEKTIAWSIEDPKGTSLDNYRVIRDRIKSHIEQLITRINSNRD